MTQFTCKSKLDFLNPKQKSTLSRKFRSADGKVMPHELAVSLGVNLPQAYAILVVLGSSGLCNNRLLIYHICTEAPVDSMLFGVGFPSLPWVCPECETIIESYDEMSFDLMALAKEPIEFI